MKDAPGSYGLEGLLDATATANGPNGLIGPQADSNWLYVVPWGFRKMLNWVNNRYCNIMSYLRAVETQIINHLVQRASVPKSCRSKSGRVWVLQLE